MFSSGSLADRVTEKLRDDLYGPNSYGVPSLKSTLAMEIGCLFTVSGEVALSKNGTSHPMWGVSFLVERSLCRSR
jgi:hypothetical protein